MDQCRLSSLERHRRAHMVQNLRHLGTKTHPLGRCGYLLRRQSPGWSQCKHWNVDRCASDTRHWRWGTDYIGQHLHQRFIQYAKSGDVLWDYRDGVGFRISRWANFGRSLHGEGVLEVVFLYQL